MSSAPPIALIAALLLCLVHLACSLKLRMSSQIHVMVNGMPGPMALETAQACLDRGYTLLPVGFTGGSGRTANIEVQGKTRSVKVDLLKGPAFGPEAKQALQQLKKEHPALVIIDYTHPSATLSNLQTYVDCDCDFVMGTTGGDFDEMKAIFAGTQGNQKRGLAVIAPNMAKQIVAMQATIQDAAKRFPGAFSNYALQVTESHQSTKADTSGTAKAVVSHLTTLAGDRTFTLEDIQMIRDEAGQSAFGVPRAFLKGHAYHTYRLTSADGTVNFELKHNVCGRRVYAEGTADAVAFLDKMRASAAAPAGKRLFNMIDVLESGAMQ